MLTVTICRNAEHLGIHNNDLDNETAKLVANVGAKAAERALIDADAFDDADDAHHQRRESAG